MDERKEGLDLLAGDLVRLFNHANRIAGRNQELGEEIKSLKRGIKEIHERVSSRREIERTRKEEEESRECLLEQIRGLNALVGRFVAREEAALSKGMAGLRVAERKRLHHAPLFPVAAGGPAQVCIIGDQAGLKLREHLALAFLLADEYFVVTSWLKPFAPAEEILSKAVRRQVRDNLRETDYLVVLLSSYHLEDSEDRLPVLERKLWRLIRSASCRVLVATVLYLYDGSQECVPTNDTVFRFNKWLHEVPEGRLTVLEVNLLLNRYKKVVRPRLAQEIKNVVLSPSPGFGPAVLNLDGRGGAFIIPVVYNYSTHRTPFTDDKNFPTSVPLDLETTPSTSS